MSFISIGDMEESDFFAGSIMELDMALPESFMLPNRLDVEEDGTNLYMVMASIVYTKVEEMGPIIWDRSVCINYDWDAINCVQTLFYFCVILERVMKAGTYNGIGTQRTYYTTQLCYKNVSWA